MNNIFFNSNIISNYNKLLSNNFEKLNTPLDNNALSDFNEILNNQMQSFNNQTLTGGIEFNKESDIENVAAVATPDEIFNNFKEGFANSLNSVNNKQLASQHAIETFASGGDIDVHEVMITAQKASLSMQMATQMRNKMLAFYNEFKNMSF